MPKRLVAALAAAVFLAGAQAAAPYRQVATIALGTPDKWDYLTYDAVNKTVLAAHGTEVAVIDPESNSVIGHLGPLDGAHGQSVAPDGRVFATNEHAGKLTVFNGATFKPVKTMPVGEDADDALYDPATGHVLVINGDLKTLHIADPATGGVAKIDLGAEPMAEALGARGAVFIVTAKDADLLRLDGEKIVARSPLPACGTPRGMAADPQSSLVFAACLSDQLLVVDGATGNIRQALPIGGGAGAVAFDPGRKRVLVASASGTLSSFQETPAGLDKLADTQTAKGARTLAVDPSTGRLYLATADAAGDLPAAHGGLSPRFSYKSGTAKILVFEPVQ